eukprot:jgi/Mesvir1/21883/Mv01952-RA.1
MQPWCRLGPAPAVVPSQLPNGPVTRYSRGGPRTRRGLSSRALPTSRVEGRPLISILSNALSQKMAPITETSLQALVLLAQSRQSAALHAYSKCLNAVVRVLGDRGHADAAPPYVRATACRLLAALARVSTCRSGLLDCGVLSQLLLCLAEEPRRPELDGSEAPPPSEKELSGLHLLHEHALRAITALVSGSLATKASLIRRLRSDNSSILTRILSLASTSPSAQVQSAALEVLASVTGACATAGVHLARYGALAVAQRCLPSPWSPDDPAKVAAAAAAAAQGAAAAAAAAAEEALLSPTKREGSAAAKSRSGTKPGTAEEKNRGGGKDKPGAKGAAAAAEVTSPKPEPPKPRPMFKVVVEGGGEGMTGNEGGGMGGGSCRGGRGRY